MANKYTYDKWIQKEELEKLYFEKDMSQKEIATEYGCSLKKVQGTLRRLGIKPKRQIKRNQFGKNNSSWKGENATYKALHYRVNNVRGQAKKCEDCGTETAKRYEWANVSGKYSDVQDYKRLCKSCHSKFDNIIRNIKGVTKCQ